MADYAVWHISIHSRHYKPGEALPEMDAVERECLLELGAIREDGEKSGAKYPQDSAGERGEAAKTAPPDAPEDETDELPEIDATSVIDDEEEAAPRKRARK